MKVLVMDQSDGSIKIYDVNTEEEIWELGYKESECSWMEIQDITDILSAVTSYMYENEIGV